MNSKSDNKENIFKGILNIMDEFKLEIVKESFALNF